MKLSRNDDGAAFVVDDLGSGRCRQFIADGRVVGVLLADGEQQAV